MHTKSIVDLLGLPYDIVLIIHSYLVDLIWDYREIRRQIALGLEMRQLLLEPEVDKKYLDSYATSKLEWLVLKDDFDGLILFHKRDAGHPLSTYRLREMWPRWKPRDSDHWLTPQQTGWYTAHFAP